MNWIWTILIVALIGGVISYLATGNKEDAAAGATAAGIGCAYIIFMVFIVVIGLLILFKVAEWLFG